MKLLLVYNSTCLPVACISLGLMVLAICDGDQPNRDKDSQLAKAVVEKAIAAHGGAARLGALRTRRITTKGVFFGEEKEIAFTAETWEQLPWGTRVVAQLRVDEIKQIETRVANREKTWRKIDNAAAVLVPKDLQATMQAGQYIRYIMTLVPLIQDKSISLKSLGESTFSKRKVLGVRVIARDKEKDDIDLYFDKENGLLLRCLAKSSDPASKEPALDERLSEYKDFNGLNYPTLSIAYYGGKKLQERRVIEVQLLKNIDMSYFEEP